MLSFGPLERPSTLMIYGGPGPLLNWVAYAFASSNRGDFQWTDIQDSSAPVDERDPLHLRLSGSERFHSVPPEQLFPQQPPAGASALRRTGQSPARVRESVAFQQLPEYTKAQILHRPDGAAALLMVFSNAQRVASHYDSALVQSLTEVMMLSGISVLVTTVDPAPVLRTGFRNAWSVSVPRGAGWSEAELTVDHGDLPGGFVAGKQLKLREIPQMRPVLDLLG